MYVFGELKSINNTNALIEMLDEAQKVSRDFNDISINETILALDLVGQAWAPNGKWYQKALELLPEELSFSSEMIKATLNLIPSLLKKSSLYTRINSELGSYQYLDGLCSYPKFAGKIRCYPLGTLLHVSAGNIFLGCIDSLLMGFLTKNINILKLSSKNQTFPFLFAQSLMEISPLLRDKFSIVYWKGGESEYEDIVKKRVDGIIAWGGEDMLTSYKKNLPMDVKLIDYGPKISIQVLSHKWVEKKSLKVIAEKIVKDIALWDQAACAASQNLFIEQGIDVKALMKELDEAFKKFSIPRGLLAPDEHVEVQKEKYRAEYNFVETQIDYIQGDDYFIHYDPSEKLRPSPLNRTLIIKPFKSLESLAQTLKEFRFYLQTCGLGVDGHDKERWISKLAMAGVKRFTDLGKMLEGMIGAPHDGRFGLTELVHTVAYENNNIGENVLDEFLHRVSLNSSFYHDYLGKDISEFPLMDGKVFAKYGPGSKEAKLVSKGRDGFIFASGGTTGSAKYSLYSAKEFEQTSKLLGNSYMLAGLKEGDVVANLFVSGNMWSSFSAVQLALQHCPVLQLPIGGKVELNDLITFITTLKPNVVFGLPGMLVDIAKKLAEKGVQLKIEKVFYAGEMLKDSSKDILKSLWGVEKFISAGYASVDAGPIGYQVANSNSGEHYLFDHIYPEIIDNELVITSTLREHMPIIRYRTGDRVKLLEKNHLGQKIQLLGRADSLIQLWGCRFSLEDIEHCLKEAKLLDSEFQIVIECDTKLGDILTIQLDSPLLIIDKQYFCDLLYQRVTDIQQTVDHTFLRNHIKLTASPLKKNKRTGKVSKVLDLR